MNNFVLDGGECPTTRTACFTPKKQIR